ncbi:ubiquitin thioesterase OTUB1-like [Lytechinus pictus]|uniref:ubiquitin thioesterase OTUB1-like n=1 Tax=Lytechinus pictus TaxID=7653 RepID=UPI00240D008D|nr:ubiquitin thioesterase OTUB1-like [Lytechinus pictus]
MANKEGNPSSLPVDQEIEQLTGMARDEAILAHQDKLEKEIKESTQLISEKLPLSVLTDEFKSDPVYCQKVEDLLTKHRFIRKTRGDGNCFFRAFGFAYFETLLTDKEELHRFIGIAKKSKDELISLGFPAFTLEDFHDTFMEAVQSIQDKPSLENLIETYCDQGISDYLVVYFRLLTSGELKKRADFYKDFIEAGRTVKEFCSQEVEPMSKESDHIHIIALTNALEVGIRVAYLDRGEGGKVNCHDFPDGCTPQVMLLYRPGHYDILYS